MIQEKRYGKMDPLREQRRRVQGREEMRLGGREGGGGERRRERVAHRKKLV
jgi:hypothetical protein